MKETCINKQVIYEGKIIRVERDEIVLEDGHHSVREVVFNSGGVAVLAFTKEGQVILGKQFRYPSQQELIEIPGGKQMDDESFLASGLRELEEETGYTSDDAFYFGSFYPTVAYASETIHLVVAKDCYYTKKHLDEGEHVETMLLDYETAIQMVFDQAIKDGKTIVALLKYDALSKRNRTL